MIEKDKVKCIERHCKWKGLDNELLRANNPFDSDDILIGCPQGKGINTIVCVCDEPGCWEQSTCGTPSINGYRNTCGKHYKNN